MDGIRWRERTESNGLWWETCRFTRMLFVSAFLKFSSSARRSLSIEVVVESSGNLSALRTIRRFVTGTT